MKEFKRKVQYYETDKMGITHHSNYIRMMEEARIDYFNSVDMPYDKLESIGIISPVIGINCKYRKATTFPDELKIYTKVLEYNSAKLVMNYIFKNDKDEVVFEANSEHCFLDSNNKLVRMKRDYPEFDEKLKMLIEE